MQVKLKVALHGGALGLLTAGGTYDLPEVLARDLVGQGVATFATQPTRTEYGGEPVLFERRPDGSLAVVGDGVAAVAQAFGINGANTQSSRYWASYSGHQSNKGPLIDQSFAMHDAATNTAVFPSAYQAGTVYANGQRLVPTSPNGFLYKVTAANAVAAGAEPGNYPTAIGATVNTGGGMTLTCERGGFGFDNLNRPQFYSVSSDQLGVSGSQVLGMVDFDFANGDSLLVFLAGAFNATNGGYNNQNINDKTFLSNIRAPGAANRRGFRLFATGTPAGTAFNDICFSLFDGAVARKAAHLSLTAANHPLDGNFHSTAFVVDGQAKTLSLFADMVPRSTPSDYTGISATDIVPWLGDISAVTGSTQSDAPLVFGGDPATAGNGPAPTSFEMGLSKLVIMVWKNAPPSPNTLGIVQRLHMSESFVSRSLAP